MIPFGLSAPVAWLGQLTQSRWFWIALAVLACGFLGHRWIAGRIEAAEERAALHERAEHERIARDAQDRMLAVDRPGSNDDVLDRMRNAGV